jgi:hypothetical protein
MVRYLFAHHETVLDLPFIAVHIFRTTTTIVNGISGSTKTQHSCLALGEAQIVDLKFLYEDSLLVLIQVNRQSGIPLVYWTQLTHEQNNYASSAYLTSRLTWVIRTTFRALQRQRMP